MTTETIPLTQDEGGARPDGPGASVAERLARRTALDANGCLVWTGPKITNGYAQMMVNGRRHVVDRIAYELAKGPIPAGLFLDHLCRNRACCNPEHLEPVTNRENTIRGRSGEAQRALAAARVHCPNGHEYTTETVRLVSGRRRCLICKRARDNEYYARKTSDGQ